MVSASPPKGHKRQSKTALTSPRTKAQFAHTLIRDAFTIACHRPVTHELIDEIRAAAILALRDKKPTWPRGFDEAFVFAYAAISHVQLMDMAVEIGLIHRSVTSHTYSGETQRLSNCGFLCVLGVS